MRSKHFLKCLVSLIIVCYKLKITSHVASLSDFR